MKRVLILCLLLGGLSGCYQRAVEFVRDTNDDFPAVVADGADVQVLAAVPTDRPYVLLGKVQVSSPGGAAHEVLLRELKQKAAAVGGHALVSVDLDYWDSVKYQQVSQKVGDKTVQTSKPVKTRGTKASADVIRFLD